MVGLAGEALHGLRFAFDVGMHARARIRLTGSALTLSIALGQGWLKQGTVCGVTGFTVAPWQRAIGQTPYLLLRQNMALHRLLIIVSPRRHQAHRRVVYRLGLGGKMLAAHVCQHLHLPYGRFFGCVFMQAV